MKTKKKAGSSQVRFCDATGLPILCVTCFRPPREVPKRGIVICDYHKAVKEYREGKRDKIDHDHPFNLPRFIDQIEWAKVLTSCEPELALLFKVFKRTNDDIARRVV